MAHADRVRRRGALGRWPQYKWPTHAAFACLSPTRRLTPLQDTSGLSCHRVLMVRSLRRRRRLLLLLLVRTTAAAAATSTRTRGDAVDAGNDANEIVYRTPTFSLRIEADTCLASVERPVDHDKSTAATPDSMIAPAMRQSCAFDEVQGHYLVGFPSSLPQGAPWPFNASSWPYNATNLTAAKQWCCKHSDCGGITYEPSLHYWEARASSTPILSPAADRPTTVSWARRSMPFVQLYNRPADSFPNDLDGCVGVSETSPGVLSVQAAHGNGNVSIGVQTNGSTIVFTVLAVDQWKVDAQDRHLAFGKLWMSLSELRTTPVVSGKLHGPRPIDGDPGSLAAGFVTLSSRAFFNSIFEANAGDKTAFVLAPDGEIAQTLAALGANGGFASDNHNPNAYKSWYWPPSSFDEQNRAMYVDKAKRLGVDILFASAVLTKELTEDSTRFPSGFNDTAQYVRSEGLAVGLHILPIIVWPMTHLSQQRPDVLVPEGLAPTFRSGCHRGSRMVVTEDLAFCELGKLRCAHARSTVCITLQQVVCLCCHVCGSGD